MPSRTSEKATPEGRWSSSSEAIALRAVKTTVMGYPASASTTSGALTRRCRSGRSAARARSRGTARDRLPQWADRIYTGNVIAWDPPRRDDLVRSKLV